MPVCLRCLVSPCKCTQLKAPSFAFHFNLGNPRTNRFRNPIDTVPGTQTVLDKTHLHDATFVHPTLQLGATESLTLKDIIGWGAWGIVFSTADRRYVIKAMRGHADDYKAEIVHSRTAAKIGIGPKFNGWTEVIFATHREFEEFVNFPTSTAFAAAGFPIPKWVNRPNPVLTLLIFEAWDSSLVTFLQENNKETSALTDPAVLDPSLLRKFITGVRKLHVHDIIHLDILPKNILIRFKNQQITDICLGDYGSAVSLNGWFMTSDAAWRQLFIDYHSTQMKNRRHMEDSGYMEYMLQQFGQHQSSQLGAMQDWQRWLRDNPLNFDNAMLYYLTANLPDLWKLFHIPRDEIYKMPNYFNWQYEPKAEDGRVNTLLLVNDEYRVRLTANWLDSVQEIRARIDDQFEESLEDIHFFSALGRVTENDERVLQYSEVVTVVDDALQMKIQAKPKSRFYQYVETQTSNLLSDEPSLSSSD